MLAIVSMDQATIWYLTVGILLSVIGAFQFTLKRLPLTSAMVYLPLGFLLGTQGLSLISIDIIKDALIVERLAEVAVIVSLFTAGLKLRSPLSSGDWKIAWRLASVSMVLTIFFIGLLATWFFGFSIGGAILLGAMLAPTDPVLASDVQVTSPTDKDILRISLTGEAGLNDGTAFPFVLLGLGLLGQHHLGENYVDWLLVDVFYKTLAGIAVGALLGTAIAKLILKLRDRFDESIVLDDFLTVGLIATAYGAALAIDAYGFLSVFAAGLALRRVERNQSRKDQSAKKMAKGILEFNEQLERLFEVSTVILLGSLLKWSYFATTDIYLVFLLTLVVRPLSVFLGLWRVRPAKHHLVYFSWFGIRGIGSIYYLAFAISHGLTGGLAERLTGIVFAAVTLSILIHGVSVTPLMNFYHARFKP